MALQCIYTFIKCAFVGLFVAMRPAPNLGHFVRIATETLRGRQTPPKNCVTKSLCVFVDYTLGTEIGEPTKACEQASLTVDPPSQLLCSRTPFTQTQQKIA